MIPKESIYIIINTNLLYVHVLTLSAIYGKSLFFVLAQKGSNRPTYSLTQLHLPSPLAANPYHKHVDKNTSTPSSIAFQTNYPTTIDNTREVKIESTLLTQSHQDISEEDHLNSSLLAYDIQALRSPLTGDSKPQTQQWDTNKDTNQKQSIEPSFDKDETVSLEQYKTLPRICGIQEEQFTIALQNLRYSPSQQLTYESFAGLSEELFRTYEAWRDGRTQVLNQDAKSTLPSCCCIIS